MDIKLEKIKENLSEKLDEKQHLRASEIIKRLKPLYKKIFAEHHCNLNSVNRILEMSQALSIANIKKDHNANNDPILKYFWRNTDRWNLLNYVNYYSAAGKIIYKEALSKFIGVSHKTLSKYINEALEGDYFIIMNPHSESVKDNRIINIRPSIDTTVAYINWHVLNMEENFKFATSYLDLPENLEDFKSKIN